MILKHFYFYSSRRPSVCTKQSCSKRRDDHLVLCLCRKPCHPRYKKPYNRQHWQLDADDTCRRSVDGVKRWLHGDVVANDDVRHRTVGLESCVDVDQVTPTDEVGDEHLTTRLSDVHKVAGHLAQWTAVGDAVHLVDIGTPVARAHNVAACCNNTLARLTLPCRFVAC